eukprot:TRINITY_DN4831_c0_g1_i4.p1 TRINITY_DN4831_c0_g1~~TRINITY_DN4831_c0_g1_i4.p1  ORF type:complete len:1925 (+),score=433.43 TRINITY_DN4831_c0_g1_i4:149-5776(+)
MAGAGYSRTYSTAPLKRPVGIDFTLWNPDEIKQGSSTEITESTSHVEGVPQPNSCHDLRMGVTELDQVCQTCNMELDDCPGHWGHISLAKPMLHLGYLRTVVNTLRCVCFHCSLIKLDPKDPKFIEASGKRRPEARLRLFSKYSAHKGVCDAGLSKDSDAAPTFVKDDEGVIRHQGCGKPQPIVSHEPQSFNLWLEYKQNNIDADSVERKQKLQPEDARRILSNIRDDQLELLGFSKTCRPEWMILTQFPVAPPAIRPAITMDAVTKTEDHTTYMYNKILIFNNKLKKAVAQQQADSVIQDYSDMVQYHIVTMMDNEKNGIPKCKVRSGQPIKSIRERLKGKGGRVRSNLMGKRVDFSARTVIGGDSQLGMDEVGVPLSIASNMTFPERVTTFNMEQLKRAVEHGPDKYPGAKFVIRPDGTRINLAFAKRRAELTLQPGYIVERHVLTNDVVLFNRQPTLHRMSMMGHRVRVMPFCTFRLNLSATSPYNADFDGDEMNLHVPQSVLTKAELQEFMMVPKNIISPKSNSPVMGIVQDSLLGIHVVTRRSCFFDKQFMMNAVMHIPTMPAEIPVPAIIKPEQLWTGKQLFSLVLPPVNFTGKSNEDVDDPDAALPLADTKVRIEKGVLLHGIIDKKSVGSSENSLVHVIYNEFSPDWARDLINGIQRITAYYLINKGFSVGVQDTVADVNTKKMIQEIIRRSYDSVDALCNEAQEGLDRQPGKTVKETFEEMINAILNKTREDAGKRSQQSLTRSNGFKVMVAAGSKGSYLNISQITAVVGQQNVGGKRIPYGFRKRTLPHFTQDDYGPESRGFVQNSYLEGLTPSEFFFHMSGGREGLIDTACKTAETGYIQRKLVKALEDLYVGYDATVRDAQGRVVQFLYGEEGYDSTKMESLRPLPLINDSNAKRDELYKHDWENEGEEWGKDFLAPEVRERFMQDADAPRKLQEEYDDIKENREWLRGLFQPHGTVPFVNPIDGIKVPINLRRLLDNAKINFDINPKTPSDLSPGEVIDGLRQLKEEMIVCRGASDIHKERQDNGTKLWNVMLSAFFASKRVLCEYRLNKRAFHWLLGEVRQRYNSAQIPPGEMVGCIAAQSIGEPATQMTLNTFHFAGVASKNVTLGVPRLKELINVVKKPKNQGLVIHLSPGLRDSRDEAKKVQTVVEYLTLRHITNKSEIWYDPEITSTVIPEDEGLVAFDWDFEVLSLQEQDLKRAEMKLMSPWILRLELNNRAYINFDLTMEEIKERIQSVFPDTFNVETSDTNADPLVVRMRYMSEREEQKNDLARESDDMIWEPEDENSVEWLKQQENDILDKVHLRGIHGIKKVYMRKTSKKEGDVRVEYDKETGVAEEKEEWVLDTDGTNLMRVMALDQVDSYRTSSNNITEIITTLGIEATRKKLKVELAHVYGAYGIYINARHSSVLCDVMCNRGYLLSINRHGINRQEVGPLMRCSYEETVEILLQAAAMGDSDEVSGVSANVMLGQQARVGTGLHSLILDEAKLRMTNLLPADAMRKKRELLTEEAEVGRGAESAVAGQTPSAMGAFSAVSAMQQSMSGADSQLSGASPLTMGAFSNVGSYLPSFSPSVSASVGAAHSGGGIDAASPSGTIMSAAGDSLRSPAYIGGSGAMHGASPIFASPSAGIGSTGYLDQSGTGATPSGEIYRGDSPFYHDSAQVSAPVYSAASPHIGSGLSPSVQSSVTSGENLSLYSPKAAYSRSPTALYSPNVSGTGNMVYSPSAGQTGRAYVPNSPIIGGTVGQGGYSASVAFSPMHSGMQSGSGMLSAGGARVAMGSEEGSALSEDHNRLYSPATDDDEGKSPGMAPASTKRRQGGEVTRPQEDQREQYMQDVDEEFDAADAVDYGDDEDNDDDDEGEYDN